MERKSDLLVVASTHVASPPISTLRPVGSIRTTPSAPPAFPRPLRVDHHSTLSRPYSPLLLPLSQSATVPRKLERAPPFDPADSHPPSHPTTIHPSVDLTPSPMAPRSFPFPLPTKRIQLLPTVSFSATRYDISILAPCPRQHPFSRYAFPLFLSRCFSRDCHLSSAYLTREHRLINMLPVGHATADAHAWPRGNEFRVLNLAFSFVWD